MQPDRLLARGACAVRWLAVAAGFGLFLWMVALAYVPGQGFTGLLLIGDASAERYLPELRGPDVYRYPDHGYDAQHYAQLALRPALNDPQLATAVDNLPYRARRILLPALAWLLGGGSAPQVLTTFALLHVAAWLGLALVLWRWLPPTSPGNVVRWFGVMFSHGMCFSVRGAVPDGFGLLLIALAVIALERGRPVLSAVVLGMGGLARETTLLAGVMLAPRQLTRSALVRAVGLAVVVALPLALWVMVLRWKLGEAGAATTGNFSWPFLAYGREWREAWLHLDLPGSWIERTASLCAIVALTVQALVIAVRPRLQDAWWRVGAGYAVLLVVLGDLVWEGVPGAAARVLLPLTLAFNLVLPRGRRWWWVLLLGNLTVVPAVLTSTVGVRDFVSVHGPSALTKTETGEWLRVEPGAEWQPLEHSPWGRHRWRWADGPATLRVYNPHPHPVAARIRFGLAAAQEQRAELRYAGQVLWTGTIGRRPIQAEVSNVWILSGVSEWIFATDGMAQSAGPGDPRLILFNLRDVRLELTGPLPPP